MNTDHDTIVAPATAAGGAIAVIRISGGEAFAVCDRIFRGRRPLAEADGYTVHYGTIAEGDRVIDDVLAAVFRAPHSYTGEDVIELSVHGGAAMADGLLEALLLAGAVPAAPGPLRTMRQSARARPATFSALVSAAETTMAVPCWSS